MEQHSSCSRRAVHGGAGVLPPAGSEPHLVLFLVTWSSLSLILHFPFTCRLPSRPIYTNTFMFDRWMVYVDPPRRSALCSTYRSIVLKSLQGHDLKDNVMAMCVQEIATI